MNTVCEHCFSFYSSSISLAHFYIKFLTLDADLFSEFTLQLGFKYYIKAGKEEEA